jgi:hypothetical protein
MGDYELAFFPFALPNSKADQVNQAHHQLPQTTFGKSGGREDWKKTWAMYERKSQHVWHMGLE